MESENSSSDSDKSSSVEPSKLTEEEPTTKRHKSMSDSTDPDDSLTNKPNSMPVVPQQMTMEEYAQLKLELHQRKIFLNVLLFILVLFPIVSHIYAEIINDYMAFYFSGYLEFEFEMMDWKLLSTPHLVIEYPYLWKMFNICSFTSCSDRT